MVKNLWIKHLKVSNTATFKKLSIYQFSSSLFRYFLKAKTPSVIPFWRAFFMPMKGARSKVPLSGHFKWLSQCQDWFTKSDCHLRILKLETWNFAWDLISPIHMLYSLIFTNIGQIRVYHPPSYPIFDKVSIIWASTLPIDFWRNDSFINNSCEISQIYKIQMYANPIPCCQKHIYLDFFFWNGLDHNVRNWRQHWQNCESARGQEEDLRKFNLIHTPLP